MDLKSKNILLNKDQTLAKITDVGMSQVMASSNKGYAPGTFEYSAPEVLLGRFCNFKVGTCHISGTFEYSAPEGLLGRFCFQGGCLPCSAL